MNKQKDQIMSNLITRTTELAMSITLNYISPGDTVIDGTCGTGQDTLSLAQAVGECGRVFAFDVQQEAVQKTQERLSTYGITNTVIVNDSFETIGDHVLECSASAAVFNLGYLLGGDHSVTTTAETSLRGIEAALRAIRQGGIVTVVLYDGHEEGSREKQMILKWAEALDSGKYHAVFTNMLNQKNHPPEILCITKKHI